MIARFMIAVAILVLSAGQLVASAAVSDIGGPAGPGAGEPFIFATHDGLQLSWLEPAANASQTALRFSVYRAGRWSAPRTVLQRSDLFVNWADFPSIVEDAKGTLFAHWLQKSANSVYAYDVQLAISKDGGYTWSAPLLLNRDGKKAEHGFVSLAPLPHGGIGAAWLDGRNMVEGKEEGDMTLRYATIDAAGVVRSDVLLDDRTCECCTTGIAMTSGRPVIAYRDRSPEEVRDIVVVRQTANGWTKPRLVHADDWKIAACPVNGPQVDARGKGVAVAWFTMTSKRGRAYVALSDDAGATFAKPVVIDDGAPAGRVDVVMIDSNTTVVSWVEQTAAGAEIRAQRVGRSGRLGPSVKIADSSAARAAGFPRIAHMGHDVFFAWTEQTAAGKRIRVARGHF